jgi:tetratricopeptide (TPR) repeat protein
MGAIRVSALVHVVEPVQNAAPCDCPFGRRGRRLVSTYMPPILPLTSPQNAASLPLPQAMQRALVAYQRGEWGDAEQLCRSILNVKSDYFEALYLLGIVAGLTGNKSEAADLLSAAVSVNPTSADARYNHGVALGELKRYGEALESYDQVIALKPDHVDAYFNRGVLLYELDRPAEALASYERVIALKPDYADAYNNRGIVLAELQRHEEALASYERALEIKPDYAKTYNNRGVALGNLQRYAEALASHQRAIALKPDYPEAHNNRGNVLHDMERYAEALESHDRAIALDANYADAYYNRGNALRGLHRHTEAIDSFERAISLEPDHASAHWNLADCRLLLGDFARGWSEYEWRWKLEQWRKTKRNFPRPLWLGGQPLQGRTILLHSELGLGDTLLFCRYAKEVAALGAKVILEVQPPLLSLLGDLEGVAEILPRGSPLPAFDYHCPLMSLPLAFKTDLRNIPVGIPYIRSDPARVAAWKRDLGEAMKPRVGLVWSGSKALKNDQRTMTLAETLPLLGDWAEWVSLQKDVRDSDAALLALRTDLRHIGGELTDFTDTAAAIELMDVVVSVDTSVAHVAGAMGKPVWIMLPFNPHDWRWMLKREDSVWYPTARLFRQPANGDWAAVIRRVKEELVRQFGV